MDLLADAISLSVLAPVLYFSWKIVVPGKYSRFSSVFFLLMTFFVAFTTNLLKKIIPSPRPEGAKRCGLYNEETGKDENGMPSGHMAITMFFIMALSISYYKNKAFWIFGSLWLGSMAWARWYKECHTPLQILGGVGYGFALGYASVPLMYLFALVFYY
jgi:membrane-associated phospholipid phosphatase